MNQNLVILVNAELAFDKVSPVVIATVFEPWIEIDSEAVFTVFFATTQQLGNGGFTAFVQRSC
ncbi:hypothetical protein SAMN06266787_1195 [Halorubrum ezzemoulense]|uniref:Uncharacterized protein n=1 Tax=Halorubrum ezzemoulense TaxID=337243 RepID=A0A238YV30_HALEZ|nr:hypothetical protein SAMN06266787_1195 [Halorubrum ezzemoulense]